MRRFRYQISRLGESYLADLLALQENAFEHLENPELLRRNSEDVFLDCLLNHYTLGVFYENKLIAFAILYFGKETSENIGYDLDLTGEEVLKVANVKLIIVHSDHRGNGLQRRLIKELEKEAKRKKYKILACTVSPFNKYSIHNFLQSGFSLYKQKPKYNGLIRNIYFKKI